MKKSYYLFWFATIALITIGLWACGGGGGGDSDGGGGTVAPSATIDSESVEDIMLSVSDIMPGCEMEGSVPASAAAVRSLTALAEQIGDTVQGRYVAQQERGVPSTDTETITGGCGGTLDLSLTTDDADPYNISGGLDFTGFCIDIGGTEATINGGADFSAEAVSDSEGDLVSLTITAGTTGSGITLTSDDISGSLAINNLVISMIPSGDCFDLSMTLASTTVSMTESDATETITIRNLALTVSGCDGGGSASVGFTIDTSDGTLMISTPTPMAMDDLGQITGGVLLIQGGGGTSIRVTHDDGTVYGFVVEADTDGNGSYSDPGDYRGAMDCTDAELELPFF